MSRSKRDDNILPGKIDKDSPIPYYHQLKELLRHRIQAGVWPPGSQLPTEAEICRMFGVSRTTVRQALSELLHEGLIRRERGRGTFVNKPKIRERLVERLTGFYQDMVAQGLKPQTQVLKKGIVPAPGWLAEVLETKPGASLIHIQRLRMVNDEPILLVDTYIPRDLAPTLLEQDLENQSLYALLENRFGLRLARGRRYIEAVAATAKEAQLLKVRRGAPLLFLRSVTYLRDGRPLEYFEAKHRGDRSRFEVELIRTEDFSSDAEGVVSAVDVPNAWGVLTRRDR